MATMLWWLASLAASVVFALQAPPGLPGAEPRAGAAEQLSGADGSGTEARGLSCEAPLVEGVVEEMESLGLAWPHNCSRGDERLARERPVMWIHLHKAAGSTICALARLNGEHVVKPSVNCNWKPFDDMGGTGTSCERREAFFRKFGHSWGAVERVLTDDDFCPNFDYAVLLRDPTALALSAIKFHKYTVDEVHKSMTCVRLGDCSEDVTGVSGREHKGGHFTIYLWYYMDNFVVRTLGGQEARDAPPGQLREEHFERALAVLKRAKVALLLEDLRTTGLSRAFGWSNLPDLHKNPTSDQPEFSDGDLEQIEDLNALDYRLYNLVRSVPMADRVRPIS